ncbi:hypothetical protein H8E88_24595 [candidate division KSB1 bacterium]|nr:hypothetical protein [candidate division KSB1 bacterium]
MGLFTPLKRSGFSQGIFEVSTTAKEMIGTLRILSDGRMFRYSKAGGALLPGKLVLETAVIAHHENQTAAIAAIGAKSVTMATLSTTTVAGDLIGGYLVIQGDAGEGYQYNIVANEGSTTPLINFEPGLQVAITASSDITLQHSPWMNCDHGASQVLMPVGVALNTVADNSYSWLQTHGPCNVLMGMACSAGMMLVPDSTPEGAVTDIATAVATSVGAIAGCIIGYKLGMVGNDTEYCPVFLTID